MAVVFFLLPLSTIFNILYTYTYYLYYNTCPRCSSWQAPYFIHLLSISFTTIFHRITIIIHYFLQSFSFNIISTICTTIPTCSHFKIFIFPRLLLFGILLILYPFIIFHICWFFIFPSNRLSSLQLQTYPKYPENPEIPIIFNFHLLRRLNTKSSFFPPKFPKPQASANTTFSKTQFFLKNPVGFPSTPVFSYQTPVRCGKLGKFHFYDDLWPLFWPFFSFSTLYTRRWWRWRRMFNIFTL